MLTVLASGAGGSFYQCNCNCFICFFFFSSRRRHTRCSRDWSSDVCSSDLDLPTVELDRREPPAAPARRESRRRPRDEIGRASCSERVKISVVAVSLKKKKTSVRVG